MVNNTNNMSAIHRVLNSLSLPLALPLMAIVIIFLSFSSTVYASTLTANVDRKQITENDSFRLFLRFDEQVGFGQPDLTELQRDFRVINQQRSNQFRSMNGKTVSFTEWTFTLSPLRTGDLTIPAIEFQGAKSQSIEVSVNDLPPSVKEQMAKEFFFDIEVDQDSTYVQAQILYTEKLYYSVQHDNATLSELKVADAHMVQLGEVRNYNTSINGQLMGVYERRFAIFPDESGELVIPGQKFTASVINQYNRFSRGRPVSIVSEPINIAIKSTPKSYPQSPWLPSEQIRISDRWSKTYDEWQVGEPVTRTITINAKGLSGSQLPNTALPIVEGLKYYPDQSEHEDQVDVSGVQGTFQQSLAIVPTQSGRITIPEVRIPWWNTKTNKLEYALLPSQTITVAAAEQTAITTSNLQTPEANITSVTDINTASVNSASSGYWILATLILLFTNVVTAFLLWQKKSPKAKGPIKEKSTSENSKVVLKELKSACKSNDAEHIRSVLKQWTQLEFQTTRLELLSGLLNDDTMGDAIKALDQFLYQGGNSSSHSFDGQIIWRSLSAALSNRSSKKSAKDSELESLYK